MPRCTVSVVTEKLDAEDRAALGAVLAHADVRSSDIVKTLREAGHSISNDNMRRHRRHECKCSREAS